MLIKIILKIKKNLIKINNILLKIMRTNGYSRVDEEYKRIVKRLDYIDLDRKELNDLFNSLEDLMRHESFYHKIICDGIEYWRGMCIELDGCDNDREIIKQIIRKYILKKSSESPHVQSRYEIVQSVMKASIHQLWRVLVNIKRGCVLQKLNEVEGQEEFKKIMDEMPTPVNIDDF